MTDQDGGTTNIGVIEQSEEAIRLNGEQRSEKRGRALEAQVASVKSRKRKWHVKKGLK